jgi:hypothetical protein
LLHGGRSQSRICDSREMHLREAVEMRDARCKMQDQDVGVGAPELAPQALALALELALVPAKQPVGEARGSRLPTLTSPCPPA